MVRDGDMLRIDVNEGSVELQVDAETLESRKQEAVQSMPEPQTWWQDLYQREVEELSRGGTFKTMPDYRNLAKKTPRHSH